MAKRNQADTLPVKVRVNLLTDNQQQEPGATTVYAFSSGGRLLDARPVEKPGQSVQLKLPLGSEPDRVRIMAGPALNEERAGVAELLRRSASEKLIRVEPGIELEPIEFHIPPQEWLCWFLSRCLVPGRLLKRQDVDGVKVDFPVCDATVEVYEVDPFPVIIDRLPPDLLEQLRDIIIRPPLPDIEPIPRPEPRPPEPGPVPPLDSADAMDAPESLKSRLKLAAGNELRSTLIDYPQVVRPILCHYYPWLVRMQKVAEVTTDDCGRFEALFYRGCHNTDQPDLYFKAKRSFFFGWEITLYAPEPVACFTHWNYECGTDVTLHTNHPLAQTCRPCEPVNAEGHWVLVTAIGNLPLSRIRGSSEALSGSTDSDNLGLCHKLGDSAGFDGRPFGGLLRLRMDFDNSLRGDLNVKYYRVSWRKQGQPDTALLPLEQEVHRHYAYKEDDDPEEGGDPEEDGNLVVAGYSLGPQSVKGTPLLYEIPPALPPKGKWTIADAVEDTTSAKFPSAAHAPAAEHGKYELVIELFDGDGNRVDINNVGGDEIRYYVPENLDVSTPDTIDTLSAHGGSVDRVESVDGMDAFVLPLHVDNNRCTAVVHNAEVGGSGADACGVLTYDDRSAMARIPFTALHPNGFASYSLTLKRGVSPVMSDSGQATPPGSYSLNASVGALLPAGCDIGGFSSHLHVNAWATNGWGNINAYDANDHAGFALAPEEET